MIIIKPLYYYLFLIINRLLNIESDVNIKNNKDFSDGEQGELKSA